MEEGLSIYRPDQTLQVSRLGDASLVDALAKLLRAPEGIELLREVAQGLSLRADETVVATGALPPADSVPKIIPFEAPSRWELDNNATTIAGPYLRQLGMLPDDFLSSLGGGAIYPNVKRRIYNPSGNIFASLGWCFTRLSDKLPDPADAGLKFFKQLGGVAIIDPLKPVRASFGRNMQQVEYDENGQTIVQVYEWPDGKISPAKAVLAAMFLQRENARDIKSHTPTSKYLEDLEGYIKAWGAFDTELKEKGTVRFCIGRLVVEELANQNPILVPMLTDMGNAGSKERQLYGATLLEQTMDRQIGESGVGQDASLFLAQKIMSPALGLLGASLIISRIFTTDYYFNFLDRLKGMGITALGFAAIVAAGAFAIWGARVSTNEGYDALKAGGAPRLVAFLIGDNRN